jgi:hypothetical protein
MTYRELLEQLNDLSEEELDEEVVVGTVPALYSNKELSATYYSTVSSHRMTEELDYPSPYLGKLYIRVLL